MSLSVLTRRRKPIGSGSLLSAWVFYAVANSTMDQMRGFEADGVGEAGETDFPVPEERLRSMALLPPPPPPASVSLRVPTRGGSEDGRSASPPSLESDEWRQTMTSSWSPEGDDDVDWREIQATGVCGDGDRSSGHGSRMNDCAQAIPLDVFFVALWSALVLGLTFNRRRCFLKPTFNNNKK